MIGGNCCGTYSGLLDEAAVYGTALSEARIDAHLAKSGRVPGAPGSLVALPGSSSVKLTWSAATANGSPITAYQITANETSATGPVRSISTVRPSSRSTVVTGLVPGTTYV